MKIKKRVKKDVVTMNDVRTELTIFKDFMNGLKDVDIRKLDDEGEAMFKQIINDHIDACLDLLND